MAQGLDRPGPHLSLNLIKSERKTVPAVFHTA